MAVLPRVLRLRGVLLHPGREGAHEKGGVEGEIGRFRRRWFVPVPQAASLAELNARLAEADAAEDARHIEQRGRHGR